MIPKIKIIENVSGSCVIRHITSEPADVRRESTSLLPRAVPSAACRQAYVRRRLAHYLYRKISQIMKEITLANTATMTIVL